MARVSSSFEAFFCPFYCPPGENRKSDCIEKKYEELFMFVAQMVPNKLFT